MPRPYKGNFVFINKNAKNLDSRDKDETFTVSSHVTRTYYHWAKGQNGRKLAPTSLNTKRKKEKPNKSVNSHHTPHLNSWASFPTSNNRLISKNDSVAESISSKSSEAPTRRSSQDGESQLTSMSPRNTKLSSYKSVLSPITPQQHKLIRIWHSYFMTFACPVGAGPRLRAVAEQMWQERIVDIVHDQTELNSWLASALASRAHFYRSEDASRTWAAAFEHHSKALAGLRKQLDSKTSNSERMILTIWSMATVNAYTGDKQNTELHHKAINRIVESMGGLRALSPVTKLHVIVGDIANSNFNLQRPVYDFAEYDPGFWTQQPFASKYSDLMPIDHTHYARWDGAFLDSDNPLSTNVSHFLDNQRELIAVHMMAKNISMEESDSRDEVLEWCHRRRMVLRAMFAEIWCDLEDAVNNVSGLKSTSSLVVRYRVQQSIMMASNWLIWFTINYDDNADLPKWMMYIPFPNLRKSFQTVIDAMAVRGRLYNLEALLWLAFVGASAEEASLHTGARPELGEGWFKKRFVTLAGKLKLRTWREAKKILKRFVYDEVVLDRFVESLFAARDCIEVVDMPSS